MQQTSDNSNSCGVTPPPTPQNELSGEVATTATSPVNNNNKNKDTDGSRVVVLNPTREPPIVFLSDFETDNKLTQAKQKVEATTEVNETAAAVVTSVTLKKGDEANQGYFFKAI